MTITNSSIKIEDCKYAVQFINIENQVSTKALVFLHDALGSIKQWKTFPETIVKHTNLPAIIIERQGYGNSSPSKTSRTKTYMHHEAWVVLPKVLKHLNVEQPILIGHSDGATIALLYSAKFSTLGIVSIAAHIFVEEKTIEGINNTLLDAKVITSKLHKYHGNKTETLFKAWYSTWLSDDFFSWNIEWEISNIKCPILVIQSEDDNYGTLKQVEGIVAMNTDNTETLILKTGGHAPHLGNENALHEPISNFILKF